MERMSFKAECPKASGWIVSQVMKWQAKVVKKPAAPKEIRLVLAPDIITSLGAIGIPFPSTTKDVQGCLDKVTRAPTSLTRTQRFMHPSPYFLPMPPPPCSKSLFPSLFPFFFQQRSPPIPNLLGRCQRPECLRSLQP